MKKYFILLIFALTGCAWTDHHQTASANATTDEVKKVDLHNCQEDAFQAWRSDRISDGSVVAIGAGGVIGGAIGGAAAGAAVENTNNLHKFTKIYVKDCMSKKGYANAT